METRHCSYFTDAREPFLCQEKTTVDLVVTSPPYPMIEMWDTVFSSLNPEIQRELESGNGRKAFDLMHGELEKVWLYIYRFIRPGGFMCINIGDAARRLGDNFRLYPNHARIIEFFISLGAQVLPMILWNKPTNAPNKFMGSGMLPAGAYVTLEHEYIIILRKGGKRVFHGDEEKDRRRRSAFFWEERNTWFSDRWTLRGERQAVLNDRGRNRSGAFPFELAYRLIQMYSLEGETVLDPFLGTGTTTFAAMTSGRNSIGVEVDSSFKDVMRGELKGLTERAGLVVEQRLKKHAMFIDEYNKTGKPAAYWNEHHGFPVVTRQEREIQLKKIEGIQEVGDSIYRVLYQDVSRETLAV